MISNDMASRMNAQINRELYSSYFYLGLSAQAETSNLKGTAAWFMAKHHEEMTHAHKMYRYLVDQDAAVQLTEVAAPPARPGDLRLASTQRGNRTQVSHANRPTTSSRHVLGSGTVAAYGPCR